MYTDNGVVALAPISTYMYAVYNHYRTATGARPDDNIMDIQHYYCHRQCDKTHRAILNRTKRIISRCTRVFAPVVVVLVVVGGGLPVAQQLWFNGH